MNGRRIPLHEWPEPGAFYESDGERVEVRAVSCSHVVCDDEQVFALEEFTKHYTRAPQ